MVPKRFLASFICVNSVFLTKCETITIENDGSSIKLGDKNELSYDNDKYIIKIKKKKSYKVEEFKNDFKKLTCKNKKILEVSVNIEGGNIVSSVKNLIGTLKSITLKLEEINKIDKFKIVFDENNFYDKEYFIGEKLTNLKEELAKLNDQEISEDDLNKKIKELKDKYLKKDDSSYYNIIQTSKEGENINIKVKYDVFDNCKELLNEQNYVFSLFKPDNTVNAPDYKTDKNVRIYNFLENSGDKGILKDKDFFYKKFTVKQILEMIKNKLIEYSDKDKNNNCPYDFKIELFKKIKVKKVEKVEIIPSNNILESGDYLIKIEGLYITEDEYNKVDDLKKLIEELENKSKEDIPFDIVENGNKYITQKQTEFKNLKADLENIEFCKLFLEDNEDLFNNYIGTLTNKIKLLGVDEDVKKIIKAIGKQITDFKEQIKTLEYKNFSEYLDENNKIKNEKVKEYINSLITAAKTKNKGKEAEITKYYSEDIINNEINNINTSLNTRLNELKYSINLVIKDNKKFKNEENNNKFKILVDNFKVCYKDYTFKCLLIANLGGSGIFNESDRKLINNTKFYVNGSKITNLEDTITKNSKVEIEFDSSLYKDKNDDKHEGEEPNRNPVQQNTNTGNEGNGNDKEVKKKSYCNKCKCSGDQKK